MTIDEYGQQMYQIKRLPPTPVEPTAKDKKRLDKIAKRMDDLAQQINAGNNEHRAEYWQLKRDVEEIQAQYDNHYTKEQMAVSGVVFHAYGGKAVAGVLPQDHQDEETEDSDVESKEQQHPKISVSMSERLSEMLTESVRDVVAKDYDLAMRFMLATMVQRKFGGRAPTTIAKSRQPFGMKHELRDMPFEEAMQEALSMSKGVAQAQFAQMVAEFIDLTDKYTNLSEGGLKRLPIVEQIGNVDPTANFDALAYFKGIDKAMIAESWADMGKTAQIDLNAKKGDLAKMAADAAKEAGWLPEQLRTTGYTGPRANDTATAQTTEQEAA